MGWIDKQIGNRLISGGVCRTKPTIRLFSAVNAMIGGGLNDIWRHFATLSAEFSAFRDVGDEIGDVVHRHLME